MLRLVGRRRRFPPYTGRKPLLRSCFTDSSRPTLQAKQDSKTLAPARVSETVPIASSPPPSRRGTFFLLAVGSGALVSTATAAFLLSSGDTDGSLHDRSQRLYSDLEEAIGRHRESLRRVSSATSAFYDRIVQTGVAASVLWKSLCSVLSSANQEVRSGFGLRVAALLADITAANESRRAAIVGAGSGAVVDWLLETVACADAASRATQAESARALAHLISDPGVCEAVLGRPQAIPNLLRFIFSGQPQRAKKTKRMSLDDAEILKGRSMLVAAIMDIVTSNCSGTDKPQFRPCLPAHADMRDIAAALEVVEEGGMRLDEPHDSEDEDGNDNGIKGIGIKIFGGTGILGLSRVHGDLDFKLSDTGHLEKSGNSRSSTILHENRQFQPSSKGESGSLSVSNSSELVDSGKGIDFHGLWDDLHCRHVAVPFATWALANWASASQVNRGHIQELDRDGRAIMTALMAPERTVKWHGSLVARMILEDKDLAVTGTVPDWSSCLLYTASQASKLEDIPLTNVALSAFLVSLERCQAARTLVMEKGLYLMREVAKYTKKNGQVQESLAKALELLCSGGKCISLEEGQKWSGILLPWVCGKHISESTRLSAIKVLACILEDYGPGSISISQGWLAILLSEILIVSKRTAVKGNASKKGDKVKTQIDQSNVQTAAEVSTILANAVINLAISQSESTDDSFDALPLASLLSLEPFAGQLKNKKVENLPKFDAADSAIATLKGVKALTGLCYDDLSSQNMIVDSGILCLLRRLLLCDDYERLAANEAYDASRIREAQERVPNPDESPISVANDSSSIRVPPTAHIRRHAARLLTILSLLPKVQKLILADKIWCKWLDDCANGRISGCNDQKIQSYARATLLNILCPGQAGPHDSGGQDGLSKEGGIHKRMCPQYDDMIFLINPELPHWKCSDMFGQGGSHEDGPGAIATNSQQSISVATPECFDDKKIENLDCSTSCGRVSDECSKDVVSSIDVVFVHGLRGGPFKTWRIAENKSSTTSKSGLVEKIDQEAGKEGTCWPQEWLATDLPHARLFAVKYKTNLTQWSGASLPLQEVSAILLRKLVAAGIGSHPVVFVTHSMGGLVVKQMLYQAKNENITELVKNTRGIVFYSCPHFGSKLADVPCRMGLVFRPAPSIGELRSGSPRLVELNDFIRHLHNREGLEVLSFSETKVTPIVEGYGGWAFRMEIVPIESAYPGFGELVVLDATDHINSCKPVSRSDPSYMETLEFLLKLKEKVTSG
ncbi:uncharacterized protein LOC116262310 isoform X2 [Nymphaea colorata]|uniref:uncharacterized protein LOC116262310 isoform X2 n=1 Tax=Nymphaea colorata TaxID=210225 RepID=UPI00129E0935|nr:uncharacterized protein LOC116262310 isoform X2 [Nymphaea colorata]